MFSKTPNLSNYKLVNRNSNRAVQSILKFSFCCSKSFRYIHPNMPVHLFYTFATRPTCVRLLFNTVTFFNVSEGRIDRVGILSAKYIYWINRLSYHSHSSMVGILSMNQNSTSPYVLFR